MEKLFELHAEDRYDLLVLDTPPTPQRARLPRGAAAPDAVHRGPRPPGLHAADRPRDEGLRARDVDDVLGAAAGHRASRCSRTSRSSSRPSAAWSAASASARSGSTSCSPTPRDLLPGRLRAAGRADHRGRLLPPQAGRGEDAVRGRDRQQGPLRERARPTTIPSSYGASSTTALGDEDLARRVIANYEDYRALAARDRKNIKRLTAEMRARLVIQVPYLDTDVHDLAGLMRINDYLFAAGARERTEIAAEA